MPASVATSEKEDLRNACFDTVLHTQQDSWFSFADCFFRYFLTVMVFYWCLFTSPIAFMYYAFFYNMLWYGKLLGGIMTIMMPVAPLMIMVVELGKRVKALFVVDWMMQGPGRVFFLKPKGIVSSFLWDCYLNQSMMLGQYFLTGTSRLAINHTWYDEVLDKDFWRAALARVDARTPRELARWSKGKLTKYHDMCPHDVVVKQPDSYLGIGDAFWNYKKDFSTDEELHEALKKEYKGREAMVLELVRPKKELGVHSLDIITMRTPDDDVKILSVLLWTDCTTDTSHSCRAGYLLDIDTETVVSAAKWYSPFFSQMETPLIGQKFPGVRESCEKAVAAHRNIKEKWLVAVGWDAMVTPNEIVFFEGNFAGARVPRRLFLSWECCKKMITTNFWPFGSGASARPGAQGYAVVPPSPTPKSAKPAPLVLEPSSPTANTPPRGGVFSP